MDTKRNLAAFLVNSFEIESGKKSAFVNTLNIDNEDRMKAPRKLNLQNYNQVMEMEQVIVEDLLMPVVFIMKYALPFHDTITYNFNEKHFSLVKGSLQRKLFCIMWDITILYRLAIKAFPSLGFGFGSSSEDPPDSSGISAVAKGAYFIFISFSLITFYVYWTKTKCICKILNQIIGLTGKLHLKQKQPQRIKTVKCVAHLSWSFVLGYVLLTITLYLVNIFFPELEGSSSDPSDALNKSEINVTNKRSGNDLDFVEIHTSDDILAVQIVTAVGSFMNIFGWMMTFFQFGVWSAIFRQLFMIFYWRVETIRENEHVFVIPHEIRTFNKMGSIIDDFNKVYGLMCLFGTVVIVTYISPSLKLVASGFQNVFRLSAGPHLLLSYVPMAVVALMAAEVQRVATNFAGILKEEYGKFSKDCGDAAESLCGIAIVHYDLSTTNIGIKGLGFFTVSYQFLTTIASLIITYSILVVQLFPHDN